MMTHLWARRRLRAYADGELTGTAREALERHLRRCPGCAERAGRLDRAAASLRRTRPGVPSLAADRVERILRAALSSVPARPRPSRLPALAAGTAGIVLLGGLWAGVHAARGVKGRGAQRGQLLARIDLPQPLPGKSTGDAARRPGPLRPSPPSLSQSWERRAGPRPRLSAWEGAAGARPRRPRVGGRSETSAWRTALEPSAAEAAQQAAGGQALAVAASDAGEEREVARIRVVASHAPDTAPGYARAAALAPDEAGTPVWRESTIATNSSGRAALSNTVALDVRGHEQTILRVAAGTGG